MSVATWRAVNRSTEKAVAPSVWWPSALLQVGLESKAALFFTQHASRPAALALAMGPRNPCPIECRRTNRKVRFRLPQATLGFFRHGDYTFGIGRATLCSNLCRLANSSFWVKMFPHNRRHDPGIDNALGAEGGGGIRFWESETSSARQPVVALVESALLDIRSS